MTGFSTRTLFRAAAAAALWGAFYFGNEAFFNALLFDVLGLDGRRHDVQALHFFLYDTVKIFLLLAALVYVIGWLRAGLDVERVRASLQRLPKGAGYAAGALLGAVTPFCTCSSVPLFLAFTAGGIPLGMTMAFLITSPIINEVAVVMLLNAVGWPLTIVYVVAGLAAGLIGGLFFDAVDAQRWLKSFVREAAGTMPETTPGRRPDAAARHRFALSETKAIVSRVWKWVIVGVGAGALLHGYVPDDFLPQLQHSLGAWAVPLGAAAGMPLYVNVTGVVPVMQGLLEKGLPIGTTLAFCMSSVAFSLPEVMMLRNVMTGQLLALFALFVWVYLTLLGWGLNALRRV